MAEVFSNTEATFFELYGPHFTYGEFRCKCLSCTAPIVVGGPDEGEWFQIPEFKAFMAQLIHMRKVLGFPFIINSGYRCPEYNDQIYVRRGSEPGEHLDGPHTIGAADVKASFERAYRLNAMASAMELGIGVEQTGDVADRYIHVDNIGPRIWTY